MNITIPSVGESITEGTISRWLKKDGEHVAQGEPLYELETDKAATEVPAPDSGVLHIEVQEGKTVPVGARIGTLTSSPAGNGKNELKERRPVPKRSAPSPAREEQAPTPKEKESAPVPVADRLSHDEEQPKVTPDREPVPSEDLAPIIHAEHEDQQPSDKEQNERREPMSSIRQRIAQRLLNSQQSTATLTTFNEADLSAIESLRSRYGKRFQEKHGVKLGLMSFFVKACVRALEAMPIINARIDQSDIVYHRHCNIGIAVSSDRGLTVPVLHHAETMTFAQIEQTIAQLAQKVRAGTISIQELQDGTFTITNGGVFGSLLSTPLLNAPQSAILGMHAVQKRPVVVDDQIVIRPMMYLALSYDHRLIDGRAAIQFLGHIQQSIQKPESVLLDI